MFKNTFTGTIGEILGMLACPYVYYKEKTLSIMILIVMIKWLQYVKEHSRCLACGSYYLYVFTLMSHVCLLIPPNNLFS